MSKVVWITVLDKEKDEQQAKDLYQTVSTYGLGVAGHFWNDRLEEMAWSAAREDLVKKETGLWVILGSAEALARDTIRYGLSLLAIGVQAQKGHGFPVIMAVTDEGVDAGSLPTPFLGAEVLPAGAAGLGPKIAARANMPVKKIETEYRLDIFGVQGLGQWFEVGPAKGQTWKGVMFGVAGGGEILAHGVGEAQRLPERSVLEYPMKGLTLQFGETEYTAWAVQNELKDDSSYYLKVNDYPASILFGALPEGDDAEVYVTTLK